MLTWKSTKFPLPWGLKMNLWAQKSEDAFPKSGQGLRTLLFVQDGQQKNEKILKFVKKIKTTTELSDQTNFSTKVLFGNSSHNLRLF